MDLTRATWSAVLKLAAVLSAVAAIVAVALSLTGDIPQAAIVLPVIVVGFTASWIQTGRAHHTPPSERVALPRHHTAASSA